MVEFRLDALASTLNFIGGAILAVDALTAGRRSKARRGMSILVEAANHLGEKDLLSDPQGHPLKNESSIERWVDWRTMRAARIGLALLAVGFGLDLYSKVFQNPLFFSK